MKGGAPLEWVKPLNPDGQTEPGVIGTYRRHFSHWNLRNLKPGFTARYVSKKKVDMKRSEGWKVATRDDAQMGMEPFGSYGSMGSALTTRDTVLMIAPISHVAKDTEERLQRDRQILTSTFQQRQSGQEQSYERPGRPLRYQTSEHGISRTEKMISE
jgi:hypothetical protein